MAKRITIKEIAKEANVSIGTVDRVLHNRGRVAQETKDKILGIAKKGNYSSNVYARNLRLNRTFKIAIILPMLNSYWGKLRDGAHEGAAELASMGFVTEEYVLEHLDESSMSKTIEQVLASSPDGIVIAPLIFDVKSPSLLKLKESKVPFVFVDSNIENAGNLTFIGQDPFQSGVMAGSLLDKKYSDDFVVYVITFGHRDLLNKTIVDRISGLKEYCKNNNVEMIDVNLERDGCSLENLKEKWLKSDKAIHILIPNSKSFVMEDLVKDIRVQIRLRLVGYDLIDKNRACLINESIDYIIDTKPMNQGKLAIESLYKSIVLKSKIELVKNLPLEIITKENLKYAE
ncbi:MAG: LacI family transcriptional regulator [Reichenbachiella sp.]